MQPWAQKSTAHVAVRGGKAFITSIRTALTGAIKETHPRLNTRPRRGRQGQEPPLQSKQNMQCDLRADHHAVFIRMLLRAIAPSHLVLEKKKGDRPRKNRIQELLQASNSSKHWSLSQSESRLKYTLPPLPCRVDTFTSICGAPSGCGLPRPSFAACVFFLVTCCVCRPAVGRRDSLCT